MDFLARSEIKCVEGKQRELDFPFSYVLYSLNEKTSVFKLDVEGKDFSAGLTLIKQCSVKRAEIRFSVFKVEALSHFLVWFELVPELMLTQCDLTIWLNVSNRP